MMTPQLNLGDQLENFAVSTLNGPGLRYVLFVQGCAHRCTLDCLNPEYLAVKNKVLLSCAEAFDYIAKLQAERGIEGVTFLGGEPFEQAEALAELGALLQQNNLSVMTYTGFTFEYIQQKPRPGWRELLAVTDMLVDGPFLPKYASDTLHWRGSSNQRLIFLSERYNADEIYARPLEKGFNLLVRPDGTVKLSGMQNKAQAQRMLDALRQQGLVQ